MHGDALGGQFAKDEGKEGQDQGDAHHAQGLQELRIDLRAGIQDQLGQRVGEGFGRKRGAQEAGQGDTHLDGGKELIRGLGQLEELRGDLVALLCLRAELEFIQRQDGDFRRGKPAVDQDQGKLEQ